jgi:L-fuculose-phosphate aldolase
MSRLDPGAAGTDLRALVVAACRELTSRGLTHGTSGNVSARCDARRFFVSPTGMDYTALQAEDVPLVDLDGHWFGRRRPSSEWRFHRDIFKSRQDVGAIVHTHSPRATALACTGRGIPAFHYMVAVAGGRDIRCAPYHAFGTQELSEAALTALTDRKACSPITASSPRAQTCRAPWRSPVRSKTSHSSIVRRCRSERCTFSMTPRCAAYSKSSALTGNRMRPIRI